MRAECTGLPRPWPETDYPAGAAEKMIRRDRLDTAECVDASLEYVDHTERRDTALSPPKKRKK